jgi:Do/DeqQ family serine protease
MTARRFLIAVLLVVSGFAGGLAFLGRMRAEEQATAQTPAVPRATTPAPSAAAPASPPPPAVQAPAAVTLPDFSAVAERTIPSVVNVSSQQLVRRRVIDPIDQLFGNGRAYEQRALANSLGSGVIVSRDGYILTNNHVVTGDTQAALRDIDITVTLSDKQELPARVIGIDPGTDLALLKVDGRSLPMMPWGDSDRLKVAEWVLAIGNPYQLSESVTLGIVSAVNRTDVGINDFENFIQTDAAINPGNSGGALINARGELVGINTAIFSQSGGYQGIGFAVSSNLARKIMADLQQYGQVRRGDIPGIKIRELTTRLAARVGASSTQGALVNQLDPRSSAARAGLQLGDVIVSFNETAVTTPQQLVRLVGEAPIGSAARVTVLRNGRRVELKLPIEQTTQQPAR